MQQVLDDRDRVFASGLWVFEVRGGNVVATRNISSANGHGFDVRSSKRLVFSRNSASRNSLDGFIVSSTVANEALVSFSRNTARGNGDSGFNISAWVDVTWSRDSASANWRYGLRVGAEEVVIDRVTANDNAYDGIYLSTASQLRVTRSVAHRNGFLNGLSDTFGLGINIDTNVPDPVVAFDNVASGNDDPAECTANAGCN